MDMHAQMNRSPALSIRAVTREIRWQVSRQTSLIHPPQFLPVLAGDISTNRKHCFLGVCRNV